MLRAFAHTAEIETITRLADGRVDAVAVVADARIVRWWPLAFLWARGVSDDGEVEHDGDAPWEPPRQRLVSVQVRRGEVVAGLLDHHGVGARAGLPQGVLSLEAERRRDLGDGAVAGGLLAQGGLAAAAPGAGAVPRALEVAAGELRAAGQRRGRVARAVRDADPPADADDDVERLRHGERPLREASAERHGLSFQLVVGGVRAAGGCDRAVHPCHASVDRHVHELDRPVGNVGVGVRQVGVVGDLPLVALGDRDTVTVAVGEEGARGVEGVVAGDLEALAEAAGQEAEGEGDADVAALVRTAWACNWQRVMLRSNGGSLDHGSP